MAANTAAFVKMADANNFRIVLDDTALGLKHRKEFAQQMFDVSKNMFKAYNGMDKEDKFVYPRELAEVLAFTLELQLSYFKVGNEGIRKESDNPNSDEIKELVRRNEQILVDNFTKDLEYIKHENGFSGQALQIYTTSIDKFFKQLVTEYPNANYDELLSRATLLQQKVETPLAKTTLSNLAGLIKAKTKAKIVEVS